MKWTIKKKMFGGFGFLLAVIIVLSVLIIMRFNEYKSDIAFHDKLLRQGASIENVRYIIVTAAAYRLDGSADKDINIIENKVRPMGRQALGILETLISENRENPDRAKKLESLKRDMEEFIAAGNKMFDAYMSSIEEGRTVKKNAYIPAWDKAMADAEEVIKEISGEADAAAKEMGDMTSFDTGAMIVAALISLIAGIIIAVVITAGIVKPLALVMDVAFKIAEGKISQKEITGIDNSDEVGQLAKIFNKMIVSLSGIAGRAEHIANGEIGADETEKKMREGLGLEEAAAVSTGSGELDSAFDRMQSQLRKLTVQARMIAADDLKNPVLNIRIAGELGDAFSQMSSNLMGFAKIAERIADGNLRGEGEDSASARGVLSGQFAKMSENLKVLINEVKNQANAISNLSVALAQVSSQSAQTIAQLSSTVTQISSATTSIAQNSQSSSTAANTADSSGRKGKELMEKLVEKIGIIKSTTETSAKAMDSLSTRSAQIGDIVSVITKIADQTNLLSLNAAIEAARAGEAGRGFAVVADEVRKLAENSASSAQDISRIIGEVQGETKSAVESVKGGQKEIEDGASLTAEASAKFGEIVVQIDGIAHQVEEIAASAEETAASAEEASAASEEQTAGIEEITASAAQLADTVKILQQSVAKFKL